MLCKTFRNSLRVSTCGLNVFDFSLLCGDDIDSMVSPISLVSEDVKTKPSIRQKDKWFLFSYCNVYDGYKPDPSTLSEPVSIVLLSFSTLHFEIEFHI